jgi:serine protease Do
MSIPHAEDRASRSESASARRLVTSLALVCALAVPPALLPMIGGNVAEAQIRTAPANLPDLVEKLLPAVVNVATSQTVKTASRGNTPGERGNPGNQGNPGGRGQEVPQFPPGSPFEDFFKDFLNRQGRGDQPAQPRKVQSLGSGFIIDSSGYIVTNNHVVADADEITVTLHDDTSLKATLVGRDERTDLALLKVESKKPLTAVPWGDSDKSRVGESVVAIGNPFGLGGTVTAGIISARSRDIGSGAYDDFLQTDASINRGNSGGPMFNINGEVIGINTAIFSPPGQGGGSVGIGFAIPSSEAKPVIEQLKQSGKVRRGWLGVRIQTVTDELAESLGLDKAKGALVASVDGPAAKADIQPGDVILKFDGRDVTDMRRLPRMVAETPVDKSVDVQLWRKKQQKTVQVKVAQLPEEQVASASPRGVPSTRSDELTALGLHIATVTPELKEKYGLADEATGIVVTEVDSNGAAAEKGVRAGDIIQEVNQDAVKNPADVSAKIKAARDQGKKTVLLLINQKGDLRFVAVRIN